MLGKVIFLKRMFSLEIKLFLKKNERIILICIMEWFIFWRVFNGYLNYLKFIFGYGYFIVVKYLFSF